MPFSWCHSAGVIQLVPLSVDHFHCQRAVGSFVAGLLFEFLTGKWAKGRERERDKTEVSEKENPAGYSKLRFFSSLKAQEQH